MIKLKLRKRGALPFIVLLFVLSFLSLSNTPPPRAVGDQWLIGWNYRKSHVINSASGAGTNYQVKINVFYGGPLFFEEVFAPTGETNVRSSFKVSENVALIGTEETGEIWKSSDGGDSWSKVGDFYSEGVNDIRDFLRVDTNTIIASTTRVGGAKILKSTDNGTSWAVADTITQQRALDLVKLDNGKLLTGTRNGPTGQARVFKSEDGGDNWSQIGIIDPDETMADSFLDLGGGKVLAGVGGNPGEGVNAKIYKSNDYGETWTKKADFTDEDDVMFLIKTSTDRILAGCRNGGGIWLSDNNGDTWSKIADIGSNRGVIWFESITVGSSEILFASGGSSVTGVGYVAVWKSEDDGYTWSEEQVLRTSSTHEAANTISEINSASHTLIVGSGNHAAQARVWKGYYGGDNGDGGSTVYLNQKGRTDFGDVRFTDDDGTTELDYWLEEKVNGYHAVFWVEVKDDLSSSNQTIYVYYGKSNAATTSNGKNTFGVFYDFNTDESDEWTVQTGSFTWVAGVLKQTVAGEALTYVTTPSPGFGKYVTNEMVYAVGGNPAIIFGFQNSSNYYMARLRYTGGEVNLYKNVADSFTLLANVSISFSMGTYYKLMVKWISASHIKVYVDDVEKIDQTTNLESWTNGKVGHREWVVGAEHDTRWDYTFVGKVVEPEPSHGAWGSEEEYSVPPYLFQFYGLYDENTGLLMDAANRAVNVTAYFTTGINISQTFELNGSYSYGAWEPPQYFKFDLTNPREYWLSEGETTAIIYIFNATTTVYTIEFVDLAGVLNDYPFVEAKRYINGTSHTIEKRKVDVEKKVIMSLINGVKYTVTIHDGTTSYEYGDLLMTSITTVTLTLKGIEFPQTVILAFKYVRLYAERHSNLSSISMVYEDLENDTDHVDCTVKFRNGTVAYTSTQYSNYFNVTWSNANYNISYAVEMDSFHNHYGEINYRAVMYGGHSVAPWSLAFLGSIPGMSTSDLIPLFLIFCVAGIFSKVNAHVGAFLATVMALYLTWLGWISIAPGMLVMALFFAILMGLVAKKRQVTVA